MTMWESEVEWVNGSRERAVKYRLLESFMFKLVRDNPHKSTTWLQRNGSARAQLEGLDTSDWVPVRALIALRQHGSVISIDQCDDRTGRTKTTWCVSPEYEYDGWQRNKRRQLHTILDRWESITPH